MHSTNVKYRVGSGGDNELGPCSITVSDQNREGFTSEFVLVTVVVIAT
jgi:hypothetical protein